MKNIYIPLLLILTISCDQSEEFSTQKFPQKWQLNKMTTGWTGEIINKKDLPWQEIIQLKGDYTFDKIRTENNVSTSQSGTYSRLVFDWGEVYELVYDEPNSLVASCISPTVEQLVIESSSILRGTWGHCDGPTLEYKKLGYFY